MHVDDEVSLWNRDGVLHTAHVTGAGVPPQNRPMPPSAEPQRLSLTDRGVYHVRCDNHPGESTWIVVVDHPYAVQTAADGSFALLGVPAGGARLVVVAAEGATLRRAEQVITGLAGEAVTSDIDLSQAPAVAP